MKGQMLFKHKEHIVFNEEDDMGLLFDPGTGKVNVLNETGKFIWSKIDGETSRNDIIEGLMSTFNIDDENKVLCDFNNFIKKLGALDFLEDYVYVPPIPNNICLGVTSKCNLNCKHCLNRNIPDTDDDMTLDELFNVIDEMSTLGVKSVNLFGGEPLMHPDFKKIVEHLRKRDIMISLNTNGTLIDDDMAKWLKKQRITNTVVSFDGSKEEVMDTVRGKGAFKDNLKGIKALKKEGIYVLLSVTLNKINYKDVRNMALLGKDIGGDSIRFNHVFFSGNSACYLEKIYLSPTEGKEAIRNVWEAKQEFGDFISNQSSYLCQKKKLDRLGEYKPFSDKLTIPPCGAARSQACIRPDGWVVPCEMVWEVKAGNIRSESFKEIWEGSDVMKSFRKPMVIDLNDIPECKNCKYQYICFLGHRCQPYYYPGGINNRSLYCWLKSGDAS